MKKVTKFIYLIICMLIIQVSKGERLTMETINPISKDSAALKYLIKEPQTKSVKKKAIILLHGVGSNETDLFSLADQLPKDYYIISARGKFTLSEGSYAWYNVDFSTGKPVFDKAQELQSREAILTFINQMKAKYGFDDIYLGGFSQGAIMSSSIGLLHPDKLKGVICLSGRILQEIRNDVKKNTELQKLKIFLAHGTQDGTLTVAFAREAKTYLEQLKTALSYHEFEMGHQINADVLKELNKWLLSN
jgi:phospholipase/carboxylesterase